MFAIICIAQNDVKYAFANPPLSVNQKWNRIWCVLSVHLIEQFENNTMALCLWASFIFFQRFLSPNFLFRSFTLKRLNRCNDLHLLFAVAYSLFSDIISRDMSIVRCLIVSLFRRIDNPTHTNIMKLFST